MDPTEMLAGLAYDDAAISAVIRPSAILTETAARTVLGALSMRDVRDGGIWHAEPQRWRRYARPWPSADEPADAGLLGTLQVVYGTPTRYDITVYRVTITAAGVAVGMSVESLCDEALGYAGLTLATCPRAALRQPPKPFRLA